jgi:hypothetical protein
MYNVSMCIWVSVFVYRCVYIMYRCVSMCMCEIVYRPYRFIIVSICVYGCVPLWVSVFVSMWVGDVYCMIVCLCV